MFSCCPLANDLFPSCPLQLFPFLWVSGSCSLSVVFVKGRARSPVCEKVHVVCFIHIQELSRDKQFRRQSSKKLECERCICVWLWARPGCSISWGCCVRPMSCWHHCPQTQPGFGGQGFVWWHFCACSSRASVHHEGATRSSSCPVCISAWIGLLQLSGPGYSPAPSWGCNSFGEGLLFEASRAR